MSIQNNNKLIRRCLASLIVAALLSTLWTGYAGSVRAEVSLPQLPAFNIPALSEEYKASPLPNVIVVATGGTLAGAASNKDQTNFQSYAAGTYKMDEMVASLPKHKTADVSTFQFGNKGSSGYSMQDLYDLSLAVDAALEIYDSAVVTTGTDTMEEIAYFLDLTVQSEKPVVVTGAMRPWDVIGTDGPANLYQAIKVASSNKTKWFGTVIMLNDVIHAAREVTKSNSHRADTFETPMFGALGYVDDPAVRIYRLNARALKAGQADWATPFNLRTISKEQLPIVEIVYSYQEAGGGAIRALVADGAKGIVTAGTGAAGISSKMSAARSAAINNNGVTFVSTTRTGSGTISGGGNGIIAGDNLNPQHARILLMLSLAFTSDFNTMKGWFASVGTQDISVDETDAPTWAGGSTLSVKSVTQTSITLQWPEAMDNVKVTGYSVYHAGQGVPIAKLPATSLSYEVTGLSPGMSYSFVVKAVDAAGNQSAGLRGSYTTDTAGVSPGTPGGGSGLPDEGQVIVPEGESVSFSDIAGHWAEAAIKEAVAAGVVKGYADGTFKPNNTITRAEFSVILMRALKEEGEGASIAFTDNGKIAAWAEDAVARALKANIISGYPDGSFRPSASITRTEMVSMITKAIGLTVETNATTSFADNGEIPEWAKGAVKAVTDKGIIQGRQDNMFAPKATATRAEAITVMMKMLKLNK
ncbi:L-asparaginase type II [Paenibacillus castaneae]|uniref:asparaginase domain-containing protein n=1 Tax=Paenibacillus castaneae TaxID=474957 RepID=UPI000C9C594E|nr:asparaginase domain-containing protein [Paenibacillus castaneae]NIK78228.1 L-asparaginase type II [Paenibacillus castaneae]